MGRFEERLAKGMQDPEFAESYRDAVLEFYQSSVAVSVSNEIPSLGIGWPGTSLTTSLDPSWAQSRHTERSVTA
jgi:hypothetical protein